MFSIDNGITWTNLSNLLSDANANVWYTATPTLQVNTKFKLVYTTDLSDGSIPNTEYVNQVAVTVNPLPVVNPVTYGTNEVCQNSNITFASSTANGVWASDDLNVATVNSTGVISGVAQGTAYISYTVTDATTGCSNTEGALVTVNPTPSINSFNEAICTGINYTRVPSSSGNFIPANTSYSWPLPTASATGLNGLAASPSDQANINATLTNTTNEAINAIYLITPKTGACAGPSFTLTLTVTPRPIISDKIKETCSNSIFTFQPANGTDGIVPLNTRYSWSAPSPVTNLTGYSSGVNLDRFSANLVNGTNAPIAVEYTIATTNNGCDGSSFKINLTVKPTPLVHARSVAICSGTNFDQIPTNGTNGGDIIPTGILYNWNAPIVNGINGLLAGVNQSSISGTLSNTTNAPINVVYVVSPVAGTCTGPTANITVTVNPVPVIANRAQEQVGSANPFNFIINAIGSDIVPINTVFNWSAPSTQSGLSGQAAGVNQTTLNGQLTNSGQSPLYVTYNITPKYLTCEGASFNFPIAVYPKPIVSVKQSVICSGETFNITPEDGVGLDVVPTGTTYRWSAPTTPNITGLQAGNNASSISGTLINNSNSTILVVYSVIPTANTQDGDPFNVEVTVHPLPSTTISLSENSGLNQNDAIICSDANAILTAAPATGVLADYFYEWTLNGGLTQFTDASFTATISGTYGLRIQNRATTCRSATEVTQAIAVYAIPTVGAITGTNNVCIDKTVTLSTNNVAGGSGVYNYYYWFDNRELVAPPFSSATVQITGLIAGPANITYKVRDSRGCFSDFSPNFPFFINALPLSPVAVNVNQVYDGLLHTASANSVNPSTEQLFWYLNSTGSTTSVPPSATNAGPTITRYVESKNPSTGCISANRTAITVDILKKDLTVTANNKTKVYDAQVYNGGYDVTYNGFVNGETTSVLTGTITFTGSAMNAINVGNYAITPSGLSADNYSIIPVNGVLSITTKQLTISGVTVADKIYDGTDIATITSANLDGVATADLPYVQLNRMAKFPSKNVGNNLLITSYSSITGTASITSNYVLDPSFTAYANINSKTIDASGFNTFDKVYNAATNAVVTGGVFRVANTPGTGTVNDKAPYTGDDISINPSGYFTNKNVANSIPIISTSVLMGADAGNYILETPILTARNITPKNLLMSGLSVASTKVYDATTLAIVLGTPQLLNAINPGTGTDIDGLPYVGDALSFIGTPTATYNSKDVSTASNVVYAGLTLGGAQANNYTLTQQSNSAATILPKTLTMSGLVVPSSKIYDGNTTAVVTGTPLLQSPIVAGTGAANDGKPYFGDQLSFTGTPVAQYNTQHVYATKVSFSGLTLAGTAASNYVLENQLDANANITPLNRKVFANVQFKKYGAIDPVFTYSHEPLIAGDVFAGVLTRAPGESIGTYSINRGSLDLGVDYTITYFGSTLTISPVDLYVRPNTVQRIYGDDPLLDGLETNDYVTIGLQYGETLGTVKLYYEAGVNSGNNKKDNVGLYLNKVEARDLKTGNADLNNYNIVYQLGNLQVNKYDLRIIAEDKLKRETEVDPALTFKLGNALIVGDTLIGELTREAGITPGIYQIQQGTLSVNDNYNYVYTPAYLTILTIKNVFVVPTAFTPNNDGLNDVLTILHNPNVASLIYFKIFNRAGNLVYQTNTLSGAWDGKIGGVVQDADAYFWMTEFVTWNNLNVKQKGTFLLIK